jgi:hypothetical protein
MIVADSCPKADRGVGMWCFDRDGIDCDIAALATGGDASQA